MLSNNLIALLITFIAALAWLRINDFAAHRGWISGRLSRKIIHMGTGPIFVLCWLLFPNDTLSRYLAALVPLLFSLQFLLIGIGVIRDDASVQAMSRTGDPREILKGPLFYGIIFVILTVIFWLDTPIGIVALMLMCGGDGLADILGRRFGDRKLPWNPDKSWIGSLGMFLGGWLFTVGILGIFIAFGIFENSFASYLQIITLIAFAGTLVESLPFHDIDNITVTLTAVVIGNFLF
jgi:phytol kinase